MARRARLFVDDLLWSVEAEPTVEEVGTLREALVKYNVEQSGIDAAIELAVFARDAQGELVAGGYGWTWGAVLEVKLLWVDVRLRGQAVGRRLLQRLEQVAIERGCRSAVLDTFSFQAPGFYEKMGYEPFGMVEGYGEGHRKVFMKKRLG